MKRNYYTFAVTVVIAILVSACDAAPAPAYSYTAPNAPALATPTLDGSVINAQVTLDFAAELDRQGHAAETQAANVWTATAASYRNQAAEIDLTAAVIRRDMAAGEATKQAHQNAASMTALVPPTWTPTFTPTATLIPSMTPTVNITMTQQAIFRTAVAADFWGYGPLVFAGLLGAVILGIAIALGAAWAHHIEGDKENDKIRAEADAEATRSRSETQCQIALMEAEARTHQPVPPALPALPPVPRFVNTVPKSDLERLNATERKAVEYLTECAKITKTYETQRLPSSAKTGNGARQEAVNALKLAGYLTTGDGGHGVGGTWVTGGYSNIGELIAAIGKDIHLPEKPPTLPESAS